MTQAMQPSLGKKSIVATLSMPPTAFPINTTTTMSPAEVGTLLSKEWVVPPRPKPGRKPATDAPPTKRKAQNRAAQRAFRERRAAKVGELEDQLKELEDTHEQEQVDLQNNVTQLQKSLEQCQADLQQWISRCQRLEADLSYAQSQVSQYRSQIASRNLPIVHTQQPVDDLTCGRCTADSHCQCIDDVINATVQDDAQTTEKRSRSPDHITNKRIKIEDHNSLEVDFTTAFPRPKPSMPKASNAVVISDPCGFCSNGTPCICAELAAEQHNVRSSSPNMTFRQNSSRYMAEFTPPPSEGDVNITSARLPSAGCSGQPGTCTQCKTDPNSTVFCKSLAASRASKPTPVGCCGGKGSEAACCQTVTLASTSTSASDERPPRAGLPPITLSCADAYTALSRHQGYEKASVDMASWMPRLHPNISNVEGRPAMEIDAANVMAVLKDFDRRFGGEK